MSVTKINDSELYNEDRFHVCQPDIPGKSASDMKEFMDYIPRKVIIPKINEIIDNADTKADTDSVYSKSETYNKTEVNGLLESKVDTDSVYSKTETDTLLTQKVDTDSDSIIVDTDVYPFEHNSDKGVIYRYKNNLYTCNSTNDGMIQLNREVEIPREIPIVTALPVASADTLGSFYRYGGKVYEGVSKISVGASNNVSVTGRTDELSPLPCRYTDINLLREYVLNNVGSVIMEVYYPDDPEFYESISLTANGIVSDATFIDGFTYTLEDWINGNIDFTNHYDSDCEYTLTATGINLISGSTIGVAYDFSPVATEQKVQEQINAKNNVFCNALKGTKSGDTVVIDDISSLEHELKIKVSGKNHFYFTKSQNTIVSNVLITANENLSEFTLNGTASSDGVFTLSEEFHLEAGQYTISTLGMTADSKINRIYFSKGYNSTDVLANYICDNSPKTFTLHEDSNTCRVRLVFAQDYVFDNQTIKIQIEKGEVATVYEPYNIPDVTVNRVGENTVTYYIPNADGSVDGVTSLYPVTTLTTDTEGVLIDVEYNRDINKAFDELQQAVKEIVG